MYGLVKAIEKDMMKWTQRLRKKACEKYHVYVWELPDCLALQDGPYNNKSYK